MVEPGLGVQLLTAGTAACIADLFTFPLDTVKVTLWQCNCGTNIVTRSR